MNPRLRLGIDAHFAAFGPRAGLFVQHAQLLPALTALGDIDIQLFLNKWALPGEKARQAVSDVREAFGGLPTQAIAVPGRFRALRWPLSPLSRLSVFYHVFGGTFAPLPSIPNVFLVPDLIPLVMDYPVPGLRDSSLAYYERAVSHGDALIVYSEHTKQDLIERLGARAERIVVTPLAAADIFQPAGDATELAHYLRGVGLGGTPYILTLSTLELRKNIDVLVRAFAALKRQVPSLPHKLVLGGSKWVGYEAIFDAIRDEHVEDDVIVLGRVERPELLYRGASLFVFPSRYEGFGLPPLEAMASGVPVIAAATTSLPEVVGTAGRLCHPDDVDGFAREMRDVLEHPKVAATMTAAGLARAAEFSWARSAQLTRDALELGIRNHG